MGKHDSKNSRAGTPAFVGSEADGEREFSEYGEIKMDDAADDTAAAPADKKAAAKRVWKKIGLGAIAFGVVLVLGVAGLMVYYFGGLRTEPVDPNEVGADESKHDELASEAGFEGEAIVNIALFGIDSEDDEGRSDAIIILTINRETSEVKLTSVMRDSYVTFEKFGNDSWDKAGHAYAYGGPELAIKMLNENFDMNITDYVTVNFSTLEDVIDSVGGVYIDVSAGEQKYLNDAMYQLHLGEHWLYETGYIKLNGPQATAYARIRHLDGDKARTGRQREVIMAIFDQVKQMKATEYPALAKDLLGMVVTSFTYADLMDYLPLITGGKITIQQAVLPGSYDNATDLVVDEIAYVQYDLDLATQHLHDFIYKGIDPETPPQESSDSSSSYSSSGSNSGG